MGAMARCSNARSGLRKEEKNDLDMLEIDQSNQELVRTVIK